MEKSEKNIDFEIMKASRDKFICKNCQMFPRPTSELKRCAACKQLLCQKCCGTKCPLCQHESQDPKISTFTEQPELMDILSGFKTHPCVNIKNGCHEEIPANLDKLKAHDQGCIFQMVPCPELDCKETFIFKDLDQHLKQTHKNMDGICVYFGTETNEYTYQPDIFGTYKLQAELVNGRKYFEMGPYGLWWDFEFKDWNLGFSTKKGVTDGTSYIAYVRKNIPFPDSTTNWEWKWKIKNGGCASANKGLGVKALGLKGNCFKK